MGINASDSGGSVLYSTGTVQQEYPKHQQPTTASLAASAAAYATGAEPTAGRRVNESKLSACEE